MKYLKQNKIKISLWIIPIILSIFLPLYLSYLSSVQLDSKTNELSDEIDSVNREINEQIDSLGSEIEENRKAIRDPYRYGVWKTIFTWEGGLVEREKYEREMFLINSPFGVIRVNVTSIGMNKENITSYVGYGLSKYNGTVSSGGAVIGTNSESKTITDLTVFGIYYFEPMPFFVKEWKITVEELMEIQLE